MTVEILRSTMEGTLHPNVGEVTSTGSQGYQPEMNLRSVFTVDQQRILQRYYENGMTNQSKSCFQLILQCAQETKLDFSVVRTWVGNKRRKMSSKSYPEPGAPLPAPISSSPSRPPEGAARNPPNLSFSQLPRASPGGDLMMTCVYSPNNVPSARPGAAGPPPAAKMDLIKPAPQRPDFPKHQNPVLRPAPPLKPHSDDKSGVLPRPAHVANPVYAKKGFGGSPGPMIDRIGPQKTMPWPLKNVAEHSGGPRLHKPEQPSPHPPAAQRSRDSSCGLRNLEIREVFSLAATDHASRAFAAGLEEKHRPVESNCFSIAMETGDVNDEYAREEELASMGAQNQMCSRFRDCNSSPQVENRCALSPVPARTPNSKTHPADNAAYQNSDYYMPHNTSIHSAPGAHYTGANPSRNSAQRQYNIHPQPGGLLPNPNNYQISGSLTVPWITECSRKRTLQDRTQFSDRDLSTLKKYWDNGMTSLGSVCREKIEAVAAELNVDCEIVRTWIGNRRRKYRLMGIEVPPPRGGPASFPEHTEFSAPHTPSEDPVAGVGAEDADRHDEVSICLSEESSQDEMVESGRNDEIVIKEDSPDPVHNVKEEAPDEDVSDTISKCDTDHLRSLLEYKSEELRYTENELENYKHKYSELRAFTRSLILAARSNDRDQLQILLAEHPQDLDDMDFIQASPEPDDTSYSMSSLSEKNHSDSM